MARTSSAKISPRHQRLMFGTCALKPGVPRIMGIVNNTPDSFSGDGLAGDIECAVNLGNSMFDSGADMVDVGGESTRPGAKPVPFDIELSRTVPIVEGLVRLHPGRISIDTMKPRVAEAALFAGASVVNDISGLRDARMVEVVAEHDAGVIIMHMQGQPRTMQVNPRYKDVVAEIRSFLADRIAVAEDGGIASRRIMIDPGIGFGKTVNHNLEILARLREFKSLGKPLVIGASRKGFIGKISGALVDQRLPGSLAVAVLAVREGADVVRVHDVPETAQALKLEQAIQFFDRSAGRDRSRG
jgi:dihydropteroate synthase